MQYRFHRITSNDNGWKFPHGKRLGVDGGYVGANGFGYEDWNFSSQIWNDGKYHLYLRSRPANADLNSDFNIVLADYRDGFFFAAALAENVKYSNSNLPSAVWQKRAEDLHRLDQIGQLRGRFQGMRIEDIANILEEQIDLYESEIYWLAVEPSDLKIFEIPIPIPNSQFTPNNFRYQLFHMEKGEYIQLKNYLMEIDSTLDRGTLGEDSFGEGGISYRWHKSRERNRAVVDRARNQFLEKHKVMFCELCQSRPQLNYQNLSLSKDIIEAHHDIPISAEEYTGTTNVNDIRFLCPNCHRAIHRMRPWVLVDEFRNRHLV